MQVSEVYNMNEYYKNYQYCSLKVDKCISHWFLCIIVFMHKNTQKIQISEILWKFLPLGLKNNLDKSRIEAIASSGFHLYLRKT